MRTSSISRDEHQVDDEKKLSLCSVAVVQVRHFRALESRGLPWETSMLGAGTQEGLWGSTIGVKDRRRMFQCVQGLAPRKKGQEEQCRENNQPMFWVRLIFSY